MLACQSKVEDALRMSHQSAFDGHVDGSVWGCDNVVCGVISVYDTVVL